MIDERLEEQASLHALGALSAEESRAFEAALSRDVELQKLSVELCAAAQALAGTAPLLQPPPALRQKILARIAQAEKIVPLARHTRGGKPAGHLAALGLGGLPDGLVRGARGAGNSLRDRVNELSRMANALQSATNDLQQTIAALRETNQVANMRIAMLGSLLSDQPKAVAVSLWDEKNQNGVFVVENLKPLPQGKDYQLWVIDPQYGTPVDAGVFQVDADGKVRFQFKAKFTIKVADKFAVTEEKKGGSPTPSGQMVLIGG